MTMTSGTPVADHDIDEALVRTLLRDQHPDLPDSTIVLLDTGWDNVMYRLGDEYVVRLPRRKEAVILIEHEQAWLPSLARRLPIPIPAPVRVGRASGSYPWPWSILPWLPGRTADLEPLSAHQAKPLADFLRALHRRAPADAPLNSVRGVPLRDREKSVEERLARLRDATDLITPTLLGVWSDALATPEAIESNWLHGDLHARNVLVEGGMMTGIIDWGDVTSGDVATDLASVWMLLADSPARADCLARYRPSDELLARAKGWAVLFGAVLLDTGLIDHPRHAAMGEATLRRVEEDACR
jgi:aminoglycoside phosphotransferase (APT) family kinase protein